MKPLVLGQGWQPCKLYLTLEETSWKGFLKLHGLKPEDQPEAIASTTPYSSSRGDKAIVVHINLGKEPDLSLIEITALFAHEAVHVFQFICQHIGEEDPSMEFEAYSIQSITGMLLDAWWHKGGGNKLGLKFSRYDK